jgi:hypothetical protein
MSGVGAARAVVLLGCLVSAAAVGYPVSINTIPTAQTVGDRTLLFEVANYGYPNVLRSGSVNALTFEYGIGPAFGCGERPTTAV